MPDRSDINPISIGESKLEKSVFTAQEVANIIGKGKRQVLRDIKAGRITAFRAKNGKWLVAKDTLRKFMNPNAISSTYIEYRGIKYPHISFLMYLLIEERDNEKKINKHLERFGLVKPQSSDLQHLWSALLDSAPSHISKALKKSKTRDISAMRLFKDWAQALGIWGLYREVVWPCKEILDDRSERRLRIDLMMSARIPNDEVIDFVKKKYGVQLTDEELTFYGQHFCNTYNYTYDDLRALVRLVSVNVDKNFASMLLRCWDSPSAAKVELGMPTRANIEDNLHEMVQVAMMNFRTYGLGEFHQLSMASEQANIVLKGQKQIMDFAKFRKEAEAEAIQQAEAEAANVEFEKKPENPVDFEDLGQEVEGGEEEQTAKVG